MADSFYLDVGQSIQSESEVWYKNLQILGTGGNAVTFLALATSGPNRGVSFAVKVFRKLSRPERRESFLKEFDFLRQSSHPSILRVFDSGVYKENHPFFVSEYLPNTLANVIRTGETSIVLRISFALQLLSALAYLNSLDPPIIHRDIKPQNIFVKGRSTVLGDFGLLKHVKDQTPEAFKESIGRGMPFRYRTPDQVAYLRGEAPLTPKSDVFQLGLVLAELFTGRNPERQTYEFESNVEVEPLGYIPGALSGSIATIINRMLMTDPDKRSSAIVLLDPWQGIFQAAVRQAHALEGRAIW